MNRKHVVGALALVVALVAVWFFAFRDRNEDNAPASRQARNGKVELPKPQAKPAGDDNAPSGIAPRWLLDVDPEGPLRLEGQVIDEDGKGVGGAEVWLGSVPPRM